MLLFKVEIIEERASYAFVRAATPAAAREIVLRAAREGDIDWLEFSDGSYETGEIEEIAAPPEGYAIDFGEDGEEEEEDSPGSDAAEDIEDADKVEEP